MKTILAFLTGFFLVSGFALADNIYIMNAPGYNTAQQAFIDILTANGHNVTVNNNDLGNLPPGLTSQCEDPQNGYTWLAFFGDMNFTALIPQITAFIQSGGKVFYQYEVSCCTTSSSSAAGVVSGVTGLVVTPNINDYIALSGFGGAGWGATGLGGCIDVSGNAYKGLDGLPVPNQLQATTILNGGSPDISVCLNFGFFFSGADIPGNAGNGSLLGVGDVNMWHDGGEPGSPINADVVNFFFPGINTPCTMIPDCGPVCPYANILQDDDDNVCAGSTITLDATSDNATYLWHDGSTNPTLDVSAEGEYWVEVTGPDATCSDTLYVTLTDITIVTSNDTTICLGKTATLEASGGSGYSWSPPETLGTPLSATTTATPLSTTTYTVTVSENGCDETADVTITVEPGEINYLTTTEPVICDITGSLVVSGITGTWAPFVVEIDNTAENDSSLIPATAGVHTILITDNLGCQVSEDITVPDNSYALEMEIITIDPVCDLTGTIEVISVQNNVGVVTYELDGVIQSGSLYDTLTDGIYDVTTTDENGCIAQEDVELILQVNDILYDLATFDPICLSTGGITIENVLGGYAPYEITIDNVVINEGQLVDAIAGVYDLQITDSAGCVVVEDIELVEQENDISTVLETYAAICESPGSLESVNVSGASFPYTILVDNLDFGSNGMDLFEGQHSLLLTDADGCQHSESFDIEEINHTIASFETNPGMGEWPLTVTFTNSSVNANSFFWDFGNGVTSTDFNNVVTYYDVGIYQVHMLAIDTQNGCEDTASFVVDVYNPGTIYIPNSFTPDYDGINDVFGIQSESVDDEDFSFEIFNRWGEVIWTATSVDDWWTGEVNDGEHFAEDGVYVYLVKYKFLMSPDIHTLKGNVTLIR